MVTWQQRHLIERTAPVSNTMAAAVVGLLNGLHAAVDSRPEWTWPDSNTTQALGDVIDGIVRLLNEDIGGLDGGSVWGELEDIARTIGWDMDMSQIDWDQRQWHEEEE